MIFKEINNNVSACLHIYVVRNTIYTIQCTQNIYDIRKVCTSYIILHNIKHICVYILENIRRYLYDIQITIRLLFPEAATKSGFVAKFQFFFPLSFGKYMCFFPEMYYKIHGIFPEFSEKIPHFP